MLPATDSLCRQDFLSSLPAKTGLPPFVYNYGACYEGSCISRLENLQLMLVTVKEWWSVVKKCRYDGKYAICRGFTPPWTGNALNMTLIRIWWYHFWRSKEYSPFPFVPSVTFRPLVKQTTTRNLYITIYIYFLDGRLCEVGAVRRGIRIVRRWRLELFDVRRRWPRQRTQRDDERGFMNSGILFSLSSSVQFVGLILPSNFHAEIKTRLSASAIFPISGDWDELLPLIWNGLCDNRRTEITVMQFPGHSLPVHHWSVTFTLSHIISRAHLRDFFRLLAIGMCHIRHLRNGRCDHHRAEITIMQFIGQSLPAHHFFYGTVRIFTLSHIVSQNVFYTSPLWSEVVVPVWV